jgi:hypothetical protein
MTAETMIQIPAGVLLTAESLDDIEDWLTANNPEIMADLRRIRDEEHLAGKGKDISEILKRWPID